MAKALESLEIYPGTDLVRGARYTENGQSFRIDYPQAEKWDDVKGTAPTIDRVDGKDVLRATPKGEP